MQSSPKEGKRDEGEKEEGFIVTYKYELMFMIEGCVCFYINIIQNELNLLFVMPIILVW